MKGIGTMKRTALLAALITALSAIPAFAHTGLGVTHGFFSGFGHPLTGVDHILAMVSVGLWAALLGGRARWLVPLAFVTAMAGGGVLGFYGVQLPFVELGIMASIVGLGLFAAFNIRMHVAGAAAIVAGFALFHGHAHGSEIPAGASGLDYALGFMAATAMLHVVGLMAGIGLSKAQQQKAVQLAGAGVAAIGAALLVFG